MNVSEQEKKEWKGKATDFKTYGGILLALSGLIYLGAVVPAANTTIPDETKPYLLGLVLILLLGSFCFFQKSVKYVKLLRENEDE